MADLIGGLAPVDWIILGVLLVSTGISFLRGFVKEALSLATWIAAIVIARLFAGQVSTLLSDSIELPSLRLGAAYVLLVFSTLIVGALVNRLICELVRYTGLSGTDRFLGMLFGFVRGALVVLVVVAGMHYLAAFHEDRWWTESRLIPPIIAAIERYGPVLMEEGGQLLETSTFIERGSASGS